MILNERERKELKKDIKAAIISDEGFKIILDLFKEEYKRCFGSSYLNLRITGFSDVDDIFALEKMLKNKFGESLENFSFLYNHIFIPNIVNQSILNEIYNNEKDIRDYVAIEIGFRIVLGKIPYRIVLIYYARSSSPDDTVSFYLRREIVRPDPKETDTNYVVVKRNGKKGLFKFISGDRNVVPSKHYIKKEMVQDSNKEEDIKLLFELNDDI